MKRFLMVLAILGMLRAPRDAWAQVPAQLADSLQLRLRDLALRLDQLEAGSCPALERGAPLREPPSAGSEVSDSLARAVWQLEVRLGRLLALRCDSVLVQPPLSQQAPPVRTTGTYMNIGFVSLTDFGWSSEADVGSLQRGDHDPRVRGFTLPNEELVLEGSVDPYFKGFSSIVYKLESSGETGVELEETYFLTTSLPGNFQVRGGQFFIEFGRQNQLHPHSWAFVDQPLVLSRMFGPEGLRSQGARLSWLLPTSWYTEAMVGVLNSAGTTTFSFRSDESSEIHGGLPTDRGVHGLRDLLLVPRIATSFDLTDTQTLLVGASAALGPNNSGPRANTQIYGADVYWKWKSVRAHQGFPFVSFQAEVLYRRYGAAEREAADDPTTILAAETLGDRGGYVQVLWGIRPRMVAGLRGERASGGFATFESPSNTDRTRISPNLTWYPTEFSKLRLQYNLDNRKGIGWDHSIWMQLEFALGAHAAHKF